jgi:hypothetical protein
LSWLARHRYDDFAGVARVSAGSFSSVDARLPTVEEPLDLGGPEAERSAGESNRGDDASTRPAEDRLGRDTDVRGDLSGG